jgi:Na+-driven multidrug efflux pump
VATIGFLLCQLLPEYIVGMFTTDPALVQTAVNGLQLAFLVFPIIGIQMVSTNFFLSIGMAKKAIFLSLTRQLIFLIPFLIVLPRYFGALGVWISLPAADFISTIVTLIVIIRQFATFKRLNVAEIKDNH